LSDPSGAVLTLVGTGSEVSLCASAAEKLRESGIVARVVSFPCWEDFASRAPQQQEAVLRPDLPSLAVEAGVSMGWHRWVDDIVSIDRFGVSAPGGKVMAKLGMNTDNVVSRARLLLGLND